MNAADKTQVNEAARKSRDSRRRELEDLREILEMPQGRRFIWRCIERAKVFASIWEPSAKIHYNSGIQDFGHFLMAEILESNAQAFIQMMKESEEGKSNA